MPKIFPRSFATLNQNLTKVKFELKSILSYKIFTDLTPVQTGTGLVIDDFCDAIPCNDIIVTFQLSN